MKFVMDTHTNKLHTMHENKTPGTNQLASKEGVLVSTWNYSGLQTYVHASALLSSAASFLINMFFFLFADSREDDEQEIKSYGARRSVYSHHITLCGPSEREPRIGPHH